MRALLALAVLALVGCASTPPLSRREQIEQFIISVDACIPDWVGPKPTLMGQSILDTSLAIAAGDRRGLLAEVDCVVAAGADCERVRACYGIETTGTSGPCNGAPPRCEDDTLVRCIPAAGESPTQVARVDCTHDQDTCLAFDTELGCGTDLCSTSFESRCDGDAMIGCNDGRFRTRVQPPPSQACRTFPGGALFIAAGEPCEASGCLGHRAITCDLSVERVLNDIDCGSIGLVCDESSTAPFCARPDDATCTATVPSCTEGVLRFCGPDQHLHDYDCNAHGFAGCETRSSEPFFQSAGCAPVGGRF